MKIYKKKSVQHVSASLENVDFFLIQNLQKITPEEMGFEITDLTINRCMLDKLYNTGCLRF
jgi:hypothetical protein